MTINQYGRTSSFVMAEINARIFQLHYARKNRYWIAEAMLAGGISTAGYVTLAQPPEPPHVELKLQKEEPMKAKAKVVSFHENHHGDVDGITLSDDSEVKFPPHMGEAIQEAVSVGDQIVVEGRRHETHKGDIHLHADVIQVGDQTIEIDHPKRPGPPKHGPPQDDWMTKKQADDMLNELRAIRKLMEDRAN